MCNCKDCRFSERRTSDATSFSWGCYPALVKTDIGEAFIRGEWVADQTCGEKVFTSENFGYIEFEPREG